MTSDLPEDIPDLSDEQLAEAIRVAEYTIRTLRRELLEAEEVRTKLRNEAEHRIIESLRR